MRKTIIRKTKTGLSSAHKYGENPIEKEVMPMSVRAKRHMKNHPNDKNQPRINKGITFGKKTQREKDLEEFHKKHIWTFINHDMDKGWVNIEYYAKEEEE